MGSRLSKARNRKSNSGHIEPQQYENQVPLLSVKNERNEESNENTVIEVVSPDCEAGPSTVPSNMYVNLEKQLSTASDQPPSTEDTDSIPMSVSVEQPADITKQSTQEANTQTASVGASGDVQTQHIQNITSTCTQIGQNNTVIIGESFIKKLLDKTQNEIEDWKENEGSVYMATQAFEECQAKLKAKGRVNIVGMSGGGKSSLAYALLKQSARQSIILRSPEQWEYIDVSNEDQIIMIDDIFGRFEIDRVSKNGWFKEIEVEIEEMVCSNFNLNSEDEFL
ncbi:hypothetical protein ScPMuIL_002786 [Solemya velum]